MKRMFDFECDDCGEVTEKLVDTHIKSISCYCGGNAKRLVSMPSIKLDGASGDFPSAYDHWANIREQNAKIKSRKSWAGE